MKLLIRNLAREVTEVELRQMFEHYGKLQSCTLVMDAKTGESKGFGFVEMPATGDAKAAMKTLNGIDLKGSILRVKRVEEKPEPKPAA
ncbi:MAG: RNA recognition motif-containing protein [Gammaproteobacteria bacterium]|jgi:RNA recognition motif-containing protein